MRRILPLLVLLSLAFAPAPLPRRDRQREDPTDVGGTWQIITWEDRGILRQGASEQYRMEMTTQAASIIAKGDQYREDYVMRLDPNTSPPAFTWSRGEQVWFAGSYRLKKDDLTVIFDRPGRGNGGRPTDFAGTSDFRFVMRRVKR